MCSMAARSLQAAASLAKLKDTDHLPRKQRLSDMVLAAVVS
jgi:hypothetical protein